MNRVSRPRPLDAFRRWINTPPHLAKVTLGFLFVMHTTNAVAMAMINDVIHRGIWPVWFGFAAIACLVAIIRYNHETVAVAGAATVTAFVARMIAVAWSWQAGFLDTLPSARIIITMGAWASQAFMAALLFFRGLLQVAPKNKR